jgi:hypothetical protein
MTQVRITRRKAMHERDHLPELLTPSGRRLPW